MCIDDKTNYKINDNLIINCPDPSIFCSRAELNLCEDDCNGKG